MATQAPPRPTGGNTSRPRRLRDELRELTLRLHFDVGLFIAPFLLVAAATGILNALTPQDRTGRLRQGTPRQRPSGHRDGATGAADRGRAERGHRRHDHEIRPPNDPESTTRVTFDSPSAREDRQLTAFVDPYTGEATGVLNTFGGVAAAAGPGSTISTATSISVTPAVGTARSPPAGSGSSPSADSSSGSPARSAPAPPAPSFFPSGKDRSASAP